MATMLLYPNQDISLGHSTNGSNGYSVLSDADDSSYIYQSVTTNDFVTLDSTFNFDSITLSNMTINSVTAVVRMRTTGSEGVNLSYIQIIGNVSNPKNFDDPSYNSFTDHTFTLTIGDIGLSSRSITTAETYNNIQFTIETRVKKTTSSKPNFEIQISEFYIIIDYTSTASGNEEEAGTTTHDLSKVKLNGTIYNLKDEQARADIAGITNIVSPPVATQTSDGLMSANDKLTLDYINPNVTITLSDLNTDKVHIVNAKRTNMLSWEVLINPVIHSATRTSNLLDVSDTYGNAYIGSNGTNSNSGNDILGPYIAVSPGNNIYYTGTVGPTASSSINRRLHVYDANQKWIAQMNYQGGLKEGDSWSTHGVVPANGAYVRVSWGINDYYVMVTVGTPSKYEPYEITSFGTISSVTVHLTSDDVIENGLTYTINVPAAAGDQYSFKINPVTGKLIATTGHIASYNGETLPSTWLSDRDIYIEGASPSEGAEVIYQLADEDVVEYDFTPIEILLYYRHNYFQVDGGVNTFISYYAETFAANHFTVYDAVTFGDTYIEESDVIGWNTTTNLINTKADIDSPAFTGGPTATTPNMVDSSTRLATTFYVTKAIGNSVAPFESSSKASKNYSVGQYLTYRGLLYKVIATIASGTTLTEGTNIEQTDVATELNLLFSQIS